MDSPLPSPGRKRASRRYSSGRKLDSYSYLSLTMCLSHHCTVRAERHDPFTPRLGGPRKSQAGEGARLYPTQQPRTVKDS